MSVFSRSACAWQFIFPIHSPPGRLVRQRPRPSLSSAQSPYLCTASLRSSSSAYSFTFSHPHFSLFTLTSRPPLTSRLPIHSFILLSMLRSLPSLSFSLPNIICPLVLRGSPSPPPSPSPPRPFALSSLSSFSLTARGGYLSRSHVSAKGAALSSQGNGYQLAVPIVDPPLSCILSHPVHTQYTQHTTQRISRPHLTAVGSLLARLTTTLLLLL